MNWANSTLAIAVGIPGSVERLPEWYIWGINVPLIVLFGAGIFIVIRQQRKISMIIERKDIWPKYGRIPFYYIFWTPRWAKRSSVIKEFRILQLGIMLSVLSASMIIISAIAWKMVN